jgi:hypothetical protein
MQKATVPIALVDVEAVGGTSPANVLDWSLPLIDAYLLETYRLAGTTGFGASTWRQFNVWVHKTRIPSGTYAPDALPCFDER